MSDRSLHIVYLHQYFAPLDGVGGTRSYEMARRLVRAGHRVTLITAAAAFPSHYPISGWRSRLQIDGIDLVVLQVPYSNQMSYPRRILAFFQFGIGAMVEALRGHEVDLVLATSTPLTIALPAVFWKRVRRRPMVFEVRDLWPELPIAIGALKNPLLIRAARWLEKWAYRNAAQIIALSPGMGEGIARTGFPKERISVIPNSCDTDLFRVPAAAGIGFLEKHPDLAEGPLVVYAGTLGLINGVEYLVRIAAETLPGRPDIRFLIVGDGKERLRVEEEARQCGVWQKNLWFSPPLPKQDMPAVLNAASLAVSLFVDLPEMWNNSANKFFDALAAGRPVAINYRGWQAEFLERTGAGLVLPPADAPAAAAMIREFLDDQDRFTAACRAAAHAGDHTFNRDHLAAQFARTCCRAAGG